MNQNTYVTHLFTPNMYTFQKIYLFSCNYNFQKATTWNIFNNSVSLVNGVFDIGKGMLDYLNDKNEPELLFYAFIQSSHVYLSEIISLVLPLQFSQCNDMKYIKLTIFSSYITFIQSSHVYLSENISLVLPLQLLTKQ